MNIVTANEHTIHLSVSERNLRGLLDDFERNGVARCMRLVSEHGARVQIAVTVESNAPHYRNRSEYVGTPSNDRNIMALGGM